MKISFEELIRIVTEEVVKELAKNGITVDESGINSSQKVLQPKSLEIDMSEFKTPVLTENSFWDIDTAVKELIVPANTVITPGAAREIKIREIVINYKS